MQKNSFFAKSAWANPIKTKAGVCRWNKLWINTTDLSVCSVCFSPSISVLTWCTPCAIFVSTRPSWEDGKCQWINLSTTTHIVETVLVLPLVYCNFSVTTLSKRPDTWPRNPTPSSGEQKYEYRQTADKPGIVRLRSDETQCNLPCVCACDSGWWV